MTEDDEQRYRLPRSVIPSRYGLVLEPDLVAGSFVGTEDIAVAVLEPVTEIVMNAVDLEIVGGSSRRETGSGSRSRRFGSTRTPSAHIWSSARKLILATGRCTSTSAAS